MNDWKAALDLTVIKKGTFNLVFHPHGWITAEQVVELIDHAVKTHGSRVKFLTFQEAAHRLSENLLKGESLIPQGYLESPYRIMDVNHDGFMDVVSLRTDQPWTRIWDRQPVAGTKSLFHLMCSPSILYSRLLMSSLEP